MDDDEYLLLPSQFLTLHDLVSDFDDDDDSSSLRSKASTSPQSTLLGCEAEGEAVLPTQDLLSKAAVEVATMKLFTTTSNGTGFFDCSHTAKLLKYPSPPPPPPPPPQPGMNALQFPPRSPFCSQHFPQFRHFPPHMIMGQVHPPRQQQQNKGTKKNTDTKTNKNNGINRPLGLPPTAWPPLPGQAQAQAQTQAQTEAKPIIGTGVFLPRRVTTTSGHKVNKSDVNVLKTKSNKGLPRRNSRPIKTNDAEILLPSEWVY
ncbi:hypothetical protein vseg_015869 [Gypsophila vaccaria]